MLDSTFTPSRQFQQCVAAADAGHLRAFAFSVLVLGQDPAEAAEDNLPGAAEISEQNFRRSRILRSLARVQLGAARQAERQGQGSRAEVFRQMAALSFRRAAELRGNPVSVES